MNKMKNEIIKSHINGGLIVSCQALEDEPLHSPVIMGRMALAAKMGGAVGIRANSVEDIFEIRKNVDLPIIGIIKSVYPDSDVYITPTIKEVRMLIDSPCDIIAFDATNRMRPDNENLEHLIKEIKYANKLAMADISTYEEGMHAYRLGVDIVSTTLSGYTPYSPQINEPDYELIKKLSKDMDIPVIAEGRITKPEQLVNCLMHGAFSIVVGGAITRPQLITKSFTEAIEIFSKNCERGMDNIG
jgi:N-acylglucosamine-6-phosphate 2-epimerase